MSDYLAKQETVDWTKGTLGLYVVKISLSDLIRRKWMNELLTWTTDELEHLPGFFRDVVENNPELIEFNKKQKCWKLQASQPKLYHSIFSNILYNFTKTRQRSSKIVWNPHDKSKKKFQPCKLTSISNFSKVCSICKTAQCKYEAARQGLDLHTENDNLLTIVSLFQGHTVTAYDNVRKYYWRIACMFMFSGNERCMQESTCPADTDPSLVFKMMKCCKQFNQIDEECEEILEVRNCLMHSPNQRLSSVDLELCMEAYNTMLTVFKDECKQYLKGTQELMELNYCLMASSLVNGQECHLIKEALDIQRDAITYEINVVGRMTQPTYVLEGIMEAIKTKIESQAWTYDPERKRRENDERLEALERENTYLKKMKKDVEEENNDLKDRNRELCEEIRRLNEKPDIQAGGLLHSVTTGASVGATVGSFGGPVGAAVGGAVGAYGGLLKGLFK